uniref:DUF2157 domain-containing protein n=1 Tax=Phenylobacterium sp. J367 TaxID=2898435 RepID=UPI0021518C89|nr:DUF2157 domain-containing protein [Phenylobacterium sp. J367]MCR5879926.1 DUF2157 domain-containing protein [Phenylobacterium sp. J367]
MASYRRRLERDLDAWIADGHVPAASRQPILASVPDERRLDASTALAAIGAFLAGAAVIAFIAANWGEIPRLGRFGLVLLVFLAAAGGGAWAAGRDKRVATEVFLAVAAMVFAAAIGLTGQIFDIAGDPQAALRGAGLAAALLALAGRSTWAATAAVAFIIAGDFSDLGLDPSFTGGEPELGWSLFAALAAGTLAVRWRSAPLAHAAGLAGLIGLFPALDALGAPDQAMLFAGSLLFAIAAAGARQFRDRVDVATLLYGWFTAGLLSYFGLSSFGDYRFNIVHPMAWLALSGAIVALGRHDRHAAVTTLGVLSLFAAAARLLFDLGFGLLVSAGVFAACAVVALVVAVLLRRGGGR